MLQTDDVFLGAFGLVRGGELQAVEVRGTNGRRVAVFTIEGPSVDDVAREYHRGEALRASRSRPGRAPTTSPS